MKPERFFGRCLFRSSTLVQGNPEEDSQRQASQSKKDAEYCAHDRKFIHIKAPLFSGIRFLSAELSVGGHDAR
jgi:hypothetical protein